MARFVFAVLASLLWHSTASAAITWSNEEAKLFGYTSVPSICRAAEPFITSASGKPSFYSFHEMRTSDARCKFVDANGAGSGELYVKKNGTECDPGQTYDPGIGQCTAPEPDQCATETGEFVHEYNAGSLDPSVPPSLPPSSICESGCLYNRTATVKGCNRFLEDTTGKDLNSVYCKVVYQLSLIHI